MAVLLALAGAAVRGQEAAGQTGTKQAETGQAALHGDASTGDSLHGWAHGNDPASLETWVKERLNAEKADIARLLAVEGARTVENTLRPFDDSQNEISLAASNTYLIFALGDTAAYRAKAEALSAVISSANTDLNLNQQVYRALAAIPTPADGPTRHYLERQLLEYRLAGVDKDDAARARIRVLQDKLTSLTLSFNRNIADGVQKVTAAKDELNGLPADYIARHKPQADGTYLITSDEPDARPVMSFATNADLRRRVYLAYANVGYPKNTEVLQGILAAREELAHVLGYPHYAGFAAADQMIGSDDAVTKFLHEVDAVSRPTAQREYARLLSFAQKKQPGLTTIGVADSSYWTRQYEQTTYGFDAQSVRPYFPYEQVQTGILATAARLFHVSFRPVPDAVVWDPSVTTLDVYDAANPNTKTGDRKLGRIYLDMHPREGKDKWFSSAPVVPGIRGRQLPEGALICNFSGGVPGDPGLMQYDEVVTFFHEFGHLMHHILGSQGEWSGAGGFNVEGDFVESPSQMLEEIFHDAAILQSFGKHYQTGKVLPAALIAKMNAASAYGRGQWLQGQLQYATYAFQIHDKKPADVDLDALWIADAKQFSPYQPLDGTHYYARFTHLTGYASNLYTYLLDKVIAIDFYAQFDKKAILDGPTAMRYRRTVLEPGASKPASELVRDFLGRPQGFDALKQWMNEEFAGTDAAPK